MKRLIKAIVVSVVLLGLLAGGAAYYLHSNNGAAVSFRTTQVKRGDLVVSISATGTVEPEEVIDVGAQIAGRILSFGKDASGKIVDYGSLVQEGTILARIDDSLYAADAAQAEAQVQSARASLQRAEADLDQMKAKFGQAERDWQRAQKLGPSEALAQASYDAYKSAYETAAANVAVGKASILQAKASLAQAQAVLQRAQRNLGYCTITSPVKGVVIDRRVNIGQTVVASLNAPSLFLLAKDLKRMQVWVAVNEADIGKIHPAQPVTFTVDSFPGETFRGEVGKVRLNASMTQNVVTYTVEVVTDNSNGRLLPYLTANVRFELNRRNGVLLVPNGALRWTPSVEQVAPAFRESFENLIGRKERPEGGERLASSRAKGAGDGSSRGLLWALQGQQVRPVRVSLGLTDNAVTEVEGEGLTEGLEIVTGVQAQAGSPAGSQAGGRAGGQDATSNPFAPRLPGPPGGRPR